VYWSSFEKFVNDHDPSSECYGQSELPTDIDLIAENEIESRLQVDDVEGTADEDVNHTNDDNDHCGNIVLKTSQVADYLLRGKSFEQLCIWDCIAQVEKVSKKNYPRTTDELVENVDSDSDEQCDNTAYTCNECAFLNNHLQALSHILRVRLPEKRYVPVPIGPAIPRRDRVKVWSRYCRLMLILFKPWRCASDLRTVGQSWEDSFVNFLEHSCPERFKSIMNNMQILHECRDSRDDHFAQRHKSKNFKNMAISQTLMGDRHVFDDFGDGNDDDLEIEMNQHLEAIEKSTSLRSVACNDTVLQCLHHIEFSRMYDINTPAPALEDVWRKSYEDRRDKWKHNSVLSS